MTKDLGLHNTNVSKSCENLKSKVHTPHGPQKLRIIKSHKILAGKTVKNVEIEPQTTEI